MDIELLQPAGLVASPAFSHVAVVPPGATTIYVGGQNGVDETGTVVSDDVAAQSVQAVENARTRSLRPGPPSTTSSAGPSSSTPRPTSVRRTARSPRRSHGRVRRRS